MAVKKKCISPISFPAYFCRPPLSQNFSSDWEIFICLFPYSKEYIER